MGELDTENTVSITQLSLEAKISSYSTCIVLNNCVFTVM